MLNPITKIKYINDLPKVDKLRFERSPLRILDSKEDITIKISEEAAVQMPMKTVASLIAMVAIGTWAYFGIIETQNKLSTQVELMQKDLETELKRQLLEVRHQREVSTIFIRNWIVL